MLSFTKLASLFGFGRGGSTKDSTLVRMLAMAATVALAMHNKARDVVDGAAYKARVVDDDGYREHPQEISTTDIQRRDQRYTAASNSLKLSVVICIEMKQS